MYGLLGGLADEASSPKPAGDEPYHMRLTALQSEGIPFGFTTYRPPDITGFNPEWRQTFALNYGDVDDPPVGIPMGPRHFSINARPPYPR